MHQNSLARILVAIGVSSALPFEVNNAYNIHPVGNSDFQHTIQLDDKGTGFLKPWDSPIF